MNDFERSGDDAMPPRPEDEAVLRRLLSELAAGRESAPDLTDRVMGRLGFVRCTTEERRRRERASALRRWAVVGLMVLAAFAGFVVASQREPTNDMAISPAIRGRLEQHGDSLRVVFEEGLPRWSVPGAMPTSAVTRAPGAVPIIFTPVSDEGCHKRMRKSRESGDEDECPSIRRTPARLPYPEA